MSSAGRAPLFLVRASEPLFQLKFSRHLSLAPPRHILVGKISAIIKLRHTHNCLTKWTCLLSSISRLWSHISCLMSHVSCLTSHVSRLSHVSGVTSPVSSLMSHVSRLLSSVSCLLSHVSCHMSHVSHLLSHFSRLLFHVTCPELCPIMLNCFRQNQTICTCSIIRSRCQSPSLSSNLCFLCFK